jgi:hypothetical protein
VHRILPYVESTRFFILALENISEDFTALSFLDPKNIENLRSRRYVRSRKWDTLNLLRGVSEYPV